MGFRSDGISFCRAVTVGGPSQSTSCTLAARYAVVPVPIGEATLPAKLVVSGSAARVAHRCMRPRRRQNPGAAHAKQLLAVSSL